MVDRLERHGPHADEDGSRPVKQLVVSQFARQIVVSQFARDVFRDVFAKYGYSNGALDAHQFQDSLDKHLLEGEKQFK